MAIKVMPILIDLKQAKFDMLHLGQGLRWINLDDSHLIGLGQLTNELLGCLLKLLLLRPEDLLLIVFYVLAIKDIRFIISLSHGWLIGIKIHFDPFILQPNGL